MISLAIVFLFGDYFSTISIHFNEILLALELMWIAEYHLDVEQLSLEVSFFC
jgi:hypothetical protein